VSPDEWRLLLRKGVAAWNQWRDQNPHSSPLLGHYDYLTPYTTWHTGTSPPFVPLDLSRKDLAGINFNGADLSLVNFAECQMRGADLSDANIIAADFTRADLSGANLARAHIRSTSFVAANLTRANLTAAVISSIIFSSTNLTDARGLETCRHWGKSIFDVSTLAVSGRLPRSFLRACGLPDLVVGNMDALLENPIQFYSCFISYSSEDDWFAARIYNDLQAAGLRAWYAPEDLKIGDKFRDAIDGAIRVRDKLLLILSEASIYSEWVEKEVETAFEEERRRRETVLFPIRIDDAIFETDRAWAADIRRTRHIGDFRGWDSTDEYRLAFDRLVRDLRSSLPSKRAAT